MICSLLSDAYEAWSGGLPDLLVWNSTRVRFVEIKGPGDSLSDRQRAWGEKLHLCGADVVACYVTWKPEDGVELIQPTTASPEGGNCRRR